MPTKIVFKKEEDWSLFRFLRARSTQRNGKVVILNYLVIPIHKDYLVFFPLWMSYCYTNKPMKIPFSCLRSVTMIFCAQQKLFTRLLVRTIILGGHLDRSNPITIYTELWMMPFYRVFIRGIYQTKHRTWVKIIKCIEYFNSKFISGLFDSSWDHLRYICLLSKSLGTQAFMR